MPTFKAYQNGKVIDSVTGAVPAKLEALVKKAHGLIEAPAA